MSLESKIDNFKIARKAFAEKKNIAIALAENGVKKSDCIELAYELQAGEYTREFSDLNLKRNHELHEVINRIVELPGVDNVAVFGVGEAKNWIGYHGNIKNFYGVELSYSRLRFAFDNLLKVEGVENIHLFKGDTTQLMFQDNCVDVSITMHSIEPNGNEQGKTILDNVINASAKYIILFEPDYSTAHIEMKNRMKKHDYVRNIEDHLSTLDTIVIKEKYVMKIQENKNNLTTCWVIEKKEKCDATNKLICPISGCDLLVYPNFMYSPDLGIAFPKLGNVVRLNKDDAVFIGMAE